MLLLLLFVYMQLQIQKFWKGKARSGEGGPPLKNNNLGILGRKSWNSTKIRR
jgi:hypothetical protein